MIEYDNPTSHDPLSRLPPGIFVNILLSLALKDIIQCTKVLGCPPLWSYVTLCHDDNRYIKRLSSSLSAEYRCLRGLPHILALKIDVCAFNHVMCDITSGMFESLQSLLFYFSEDSTLHKATFFMLWTVTTPPTCPSLEELKRMLLPTWDSMTILGLKIMSDLLDLEAMQELRSVSLLNCTFSTMPTIPMTCSTLVVDGCNNIRLGKIALRNYPYNNEALLISQETQRLNFRDCLLRMGRSWSSISLIGLNIWRLYIVGSTVTDDYLVVQDAQQVTARGFHNLLYFGRPCSQFGKLIYIAVDMETQRIMCSDRISLAHLHNYLLKLDGVYRVVGGDESRKGATIEFEIPENFGVNTDLCASTVIANWQELSKTEE
ncbi:hypothetical protein POJ06DRAFT_288772 [Lipomyces tetrasporus]|uniref:Uncharacterized protein n=1 Tax=Lipomyces tetrasporus TaxID=54092 RepID=A0AAD7VV76_9ASCO|nr:uncharacterized protein POJ06DRAFT_288772 [Lipomyces tetrasporus]KAJ8101935.1 hypothetical protein POJ06DRAFT_288772 [Lipomyces tetrasporus]